MKIKRKVMKYVEVEEEVEGGLALIEEKGGTLLAMVDEEGTVFRAGNLMKFKDNGEVIRYFDVNPVFGFKLTEEGKLFC